MKNIEILYLLSAYTMGGIIFLINRNKDFLTVSETAAGNRVGRQVFFWGLLASGILYLLLMFSWVFPAFDFGALSKLLAVALFIFQLLTAIVPARGRKQNIIHLTAAFGLGISMLITVITFVFQYQIQSAVRVVCTLLALVMFSLMIAVRRLSSTKHFKHQNIFFGCWHLALFSVVYFG